jgi:hypothetical protein
MQTQVQATPADSAGQRIPGDGVTTCCFCSAPLAADTWWCDDCSPRRDEIAREKAARGGLSRLAYSAKCEITDPEVREWMRDGVAGINRIRVRRGWAKMSEPETRETIRWVANHTRAAELVKAVESPEERAALVALMRKIIDEEVRRVIVSDSLTNPSA